MLDSVVVFDSESHANCILQGARCADRMYVLTLRVPWASGNMCALMVKNRDVVVIGRLRVLGHEGHGELDIDTTIIPFCQCQLQ